MAAGALSVILLCVFAAPAQQGLNAPQSQKGHSGTRNTAAYRIAGRVVSATDGHALPGATVSIGNVRGGDVEASVAAGEGGTFAFEEVAPGKYSLFRQRRGFIGATYNQHDQFSTAIVTGAGIDTETLVLRLEPDALLSGRVLDEYGEPVQGAQITLYREGYETGKKATKTFSATQTDTFGEFALGQLRPGRYFVAVRATPWYAVHPAPPDPQSPVLTGVDPALDVAYPLTFYGGATKAEEATPIVLKAGERFRADIHLVPVRAVKITLKGAPGSILSTLQTPVFDGMEQVPAQVQQTTDGGSEVVGLAPGQYQFATMDGTAGGGPQVGSQIGEVDLTQGPMEVDAQRSVSEGSILLNLVMENGAKLPAQSTVLLRGTRPGIDERQMVDEDGTVTFRGVPPDDYHFLIFGDNRIWQTIRLEEGGKSLSQDHRLLAAGESVSLKLVVAGSAKLVEGLAVRDGKPMAGAMIVLVPVDAIQNIDLFRRDQSDLDGTFALPDVAAGRYILVAIENGWTLEWGRPEVLAPFLAKGMPVEVPSIQRETLELTSPVTVQPYR
jgi:hypothetical protein